MLTFAELARRLNTHPGTVRRWVVRGLGGVKLPATCVGDRWYVAWDAYAVWQRRVTAGKRRDATDRADAALAEVRRLRAAGV